jgi:chitinase
MSLIPEMPGGCCVPPGIFANFADSIRTLVISLTLPVLPSGLVTAGTNLLAAAHSAGFNPDVVNVMAMDYDSGVDGLSGVAQNNFQYSQTFEAFH